MGAGRRQRDSEPRTGPLPRAFNLGKKAAPPKVGMVPFISMLTENNVRKGFFEHDQFTAVGIALPEELRP